MDIFAMKKKPHLSASGINDYIDCGLLYRFSRIDNLKPEFSPDSLEFGSAIHETLAHYNEQRLVGSHMSVEEVQTFFEERWTSHARDNDEIVYHNGKDFESYLQDGKALLKAFRETANHDHFTVIAVEEPFHFQLEGVEIPIIGVIDLIEVDDSGTVIITDYKTAAKAYTVDQVNRNLQLTLYYLAMKANGYLTREVLLKVDGLIKTKTPKYEPYYSTRDDDIAQRTAKKIKAVWQGISGGVFIPNDASWKCPDCRFKSRCSEWFSRQENNKS